MVYHLELQQTTLLLNIDNHTHFEDFSFQIEV